mmetsp:Transcript_7285/g.7523  ORF Transcript_7285/g.7523 Transcript_7285/m.7523 type:complete len:136 (+) Transcript_7285:25-432(+)
MEISEDSLKRIVYDSISNIKDPELPQFSLEDLDIVDSDKVQVRKMKNYFEVRIEWKPTVKTCKFTENIGLAMRYQLITDEILSKYSNKVKYLFFIEEDTHILKAEIDKKINDKERYLAAFENESVVDYIKQLLDS